MKCTAYSRAERSSPADGVSSCKQSPRLSLSSAAPLKNTTLVVFFLICAKFFAQICTISLKLCVEPVVCARRLRILRALIAFSCRQQLHNPWTNFVHGFGADDQTWTGDLILTKDVLYHLSHISIFWRKRRDSNPRGLSPKRFSRPPRYDRFDTLP